MSVPFGEPITRGYDASFTGKLLHSERSEFQKIDVYDHEHFGRILTLDDTIQTTERDEYCYHELLVHPALSSRDSVDSVLVIGGGDGGTLRHVLMHGCSKAVMCEIDGAVVRVSREFLPTISSGALDDARATVVIDDGAAFVARYDNVFDAILVDCTDPVGAALILFSPEFYASCRRALKPDGVLVSQTGTPLYHPDEFRGALANMSEVFGVVEAYVGFVPTYPGVIWSFGVATDGAPVSSAPATEVGARLQRRGIETRYYTPELHAGAFALPAFVDELVRDAQAKPASVPRR